MNLYAKSKILTLKYVSELSHHWFGYYMTLSEIILWKCQLDPYKQTSVKLNSQYKLPKCDSNLVWKMVAIFFKPHIVIRGPLDIKRHKKYHYQYNDRVIFIMGIPISDILYIGRLSLFFKFGHAELQLNFVKLYHLFDLSLCQQATVFNG